MSQDNMTGKVAIVTGGAGAIGGATARLLATRGCRLVIADIQRAASEAMAATLPDAMPVHLDLADELSIKAMINAVIARYGQIDILHNNAALLGPDIAARDGDVETMETDIWDRTFAVNLRGTMIACREALPHLRKTKGCIINTVSNLALQGHMIQAAYGTSKAALIQLTRAIAASHGIHGIRCNAVAPGMTMTPGLRDAFPPRLRALVEAETLRDQLGDPEDIAEAVVFLASPAARNISGHVLVSDGGLSTHVPGLAGFQTYFGDAS